MIRHKYSTRSIVLLSVLTAAFSTSAGDDHCSYTSDSKPELTDCSEAANLNAMNNCQEGGFEAAKSKAKSLLADLQSTYKTDEPELYERLNESHRAWKKYIKSECEYEIHYSSGTQAEAANRFLCLEAHYHERTEYLAEKLRTP